MQQTMKRSVFSTCQHLLKLFKKLATNSLFIKFSYIQWTFRFSETFIQWWRIKYWIGKSSWVFEIHIYYQYILFIVLTGTWPFIISRLRFSFLLAMIGQKWHWYVTEYIILTVGVETKNRGLSAGPPSPLPLPFFPSYLVPWRATTQAKCVQTLLV